MVVIVVGLEVGWEAEAEVVVRTVTCVCRVCRMEGVGGGERREGVDDIWRGEGRNRCYRKVWVGR